MICKMVEEKKSEEEYISEDKKEDAGEDKVEEKMHKVAVIAGDLNGKTVTDATLSLYDSFKEVLSRPIEHTMTPFNTDYFIEKGITELTDENMKELREYDSIFLGAIGDPTKIEPGVIENGILIKIRQGFEQYVNLRPIKQMPGTKCEVLGRTFTNVDFLICRENTEGLYINKGYVKNKGTDDELGVQEMHCSYKGVKRLTEFALREALERDRFEKPRIHFVFKNNVLFDASTSWTRVEEETRERMGDIIDVRYMHFDNFMMQVMQNPEQFDVVVMENFMGDAASDLASLLQGGIGTAISGNINPTSEYPSMYEPIHGTAPDKWYETDEVGNLLPDTYNPALIQGIKPEATFLAYAMMLKHMGEYDAADLVRTAAERNILDPKYKEKSLNELVSQAKEHIVNEQRVKD